MVFSKQVCGKIDFRSKKYMLCVCINLCIKCVVSFKKDLMGKVTDCKEIARFRFPFSKVSTFYGFNKNLALRLFSKV